MRKNELYKYQIQNIRNDEMYIKIYYKKVLITWVLQSFSIQEASKIADEIIKKTKNTKYYNISCIFICKTKSDINKIYSVLMEYYYNSRLPNIDLITLSLKNFLSDCDVWQNFD